MGKSYKRYPIVRQERENYHYLNRQIRRDKLAKIPKGGSYRRHRPHWNTWAYRWTKEQAIQEYESNEFNWINEKFPTLEDYLNYWESITLRK